MRRDSERALFTGEAAQDQSRPVPTGQPIRDPPLRPPTGQWSKVKGPEAPARTKNQNGCQARVPVTTDRALLPRGPRSASLSESRGLIPLAPAQLERQATGSSDRQTPEPRVLLLQLERQATGSPGLQLERQATGSPDRQPPTESRVLLRCSNRQCGAAPPVIGHWSAGAGAGSSCLPHDSVLIRRVKDHGPSRALGPKVKGPETRTKGRVGRRSASNRRASPSPLAPQRGTSGGSGRARHQPVPNV